MSMRATLGYAKQISFLFVSLVHLAMELLQSAYCKAYLMEIHKGTEPSLKKLKNRFVHDEDGVEPKKCLDGLPLLYFVSMIPNHLRFHYLNK